MLNPKDEVWIGEKVPPKSDDNILVWMRFDKFFRQLGRVASGNYNRTSPNVVDKIQ